jgi:ribose transport system substrate-binding protein
VVQVVRKGVSKLAQEEGWEVLIDPTQGGDLQDQLGVLDTWITQGVTAINAYPGQPSAYEAIAQRAVDEGIIWTTYINKMDIGAGGVGLPPELSGEATGQATVDWIKENDPDAEVLILTASQQAELKDRVEIPKKMILEQTDAKIVAEQDAIDQATGLRVTEDVLQAHPNVSVVVGFNDDGALGAAEALRKAGKLSADQVWVIGQDGALDALEAVRKPGSYYSATAAVDGPDFYSKIVGVVKRAIDKGWKPGDPQEWVELPPILITSENPEEADRLLAAYEELTK